MSSVFYNQGDDWWCNTKFTGNAQKPCGYRTWIDFWEDQAETEAYKCHVKNCYGKDVVGCHVNKCHGDDGTKYIVPLCRKHNGDHNGQFKLHNGAQMVVAPSGYGRLNQDFEYQETQYDESENDDGESEECEGGSEDSERGFDQNYGSYSNKRYNNYTNKRRYIEDNEEGSDDSDGDDGGYQKNYGGYQKNYGGYQKNYGSYSNKRRRNY